MLKFGTDIEIPYEILEALQNDKLVIFCGAGISYYEGKGLPLFPDLVRKAYAHFNNPLPEWDKDNNTYKYEVENKSPAEASFERGFYDKTLEYLENSLPDPTYFRKWLLKQFICDEKESPDLRFHKALLKLAQLKGGKKGHRIITTNVDNYFDIAAKELGHEFSPLNQSPLPLPDRERWQSLTYLHGCAIQATQSNGQNLVFTSSDFSKAYLLDGWAGRFIAEIFRQYTVLFVGYGVEDPLVTYLMDGLNSNRQISRCFAFADYKGQEDMFECHDRWTHKNITPILFNARTDSSGYIDLQTTVENWSNEFSQSAEDKAKNVTEIISQEFDPKNEVCINNYRKFILYISQNIQANKFTKTQQAFMDTPGHISWLRAFDTPIDLSPDHDPSVNIRLTAVKTLSPLNPQALSSHANQDRLRVDEIPIAGPKPTAELSNLSRMVFIWLCRHHLNKIEMVKWVAEKRGQLHDDFKDYIRIQLHLGSDWHDRLSDDYKDFWQVLINLPQPFRDASLSNYFNATIEGSTLVNALRPSLTIEDSFSWSTPDDNTPFRVTHFKVAIANEKLVKAIFEDYKLDNPVNNIAPLKENLHLYALDLTNLIKQAWRLTHDLPEKARAKEFPSSPYSDHIYSSLGYIIHWTYQACIQLYDKAPQEACAIWLDWIAAYEKQSCTYFENLIFKFIRFDAENGKHCSIDAILNTYKTPYMPGTERDFLAFIRLCGNNFSKKQIATLLGKMETYKEHSIYLQDRFLAQLYSAEPKAPLNTAQTKRAQEFLEKNEIQEDQSIIDARWVPRTKALTANGRSPQEYARNIIQKSQSDHRHSYTDIVEQLPSTEGLLYALDVTLVFQDQLSEKINAVQMFPIQIWNSLFAGAKQCLDSHKNDETALAQLQNTISDFHQKIVSLLENHSSKVQIANGLSQWLKSLSSLFKKDDNRAISVIENEWNFWELFDLAFPLVGSVPSDISESEIINIAANSGAGRLCEALINRLDVHVNYKPETCLDRLEAFLKSPKGPHQQACVFIAFQMISIGRMNLKWLKENLLPSMKWDSPNRLLTESLWQGFLWQPRVDDNIWSILKPEYLNTLYYLRDIEKLDEALRPTIKSDQPIQHGKKGFYSLLTIVLMAQSEMEVSARFTSEELRKIFKNIGTDGMNEIVRSIKYQEDYPLNAITWKNKIAPWFESYWPTDKKRLQGFNLGILIDILFSLGEDFPLVFKRLKAKSLIFKTSNRQGQGSLHYVFHSLKNSETLTIFPEQILCLLDLIIGDYILEYEVREFETILNKLISIKPDLENEQAYMRLSLLAS